ncbi:hemolysin family protein [Gulosibacter molinativorax]|uniref:HlyC/CorC family transporter n=1 Tax=Gulosibacter molinativorax TaxID=256821 RepID=A0ABT7C3I4_9MICO|nr:hemolysin family protein [Gulosibacter molinativorax]MDJ1369820.1 HlyC/CorC family transporter [Gulosibacter molinativorax]QUY61785.1 Magnesium and cobalt efflux protein CorC [Gulosibacter molinativorax]
MTWFLVISILIVLVLISTLLAAAQAALAQLPRADIAELSEERPGNRFLMGIAANPEGHEHAVTFTRAGTETLATALLAVWFTDRSGQPWIAFAVTAVVMLVVHFLLSGSSAKSIGRAHPQKTVSALSWLIRAARVLTGVIADLLTAIGDSVTPNPTPRSGSLSSEEQLLSMVDEAAEDEVLEDEDRELIHSVFDFSDRLVREVMVARTDMHTVDADSTVAQALGELLDDGISRAPIIGRDSDDVRGVAYQKDLSREMLHGGTRGAGTVLTVARPATFVPESLGASELLRRMQRESTHFAIVIDEYGGVAGLVTFEDLIEELVGEINDEHDRDTEEIELLASGAMRVSSRMSTSELGELFDIEIDDEDVDSVGGLMSKALGKIPVLGDRVVVDGLELTADRVGRRHRVTEVSVRFIGTRESGSGLSAPLQDSLTGVLDDRTSKLHKENHEY